MQFEWDERKNQANHAKHGLDLRTAALVFRDSRVRSGRDRRYADVEARWYSIGRIGITIIYVAHTMWEDEDGAEIIRIISARKATPREERRYYTQ